VDLNPRRWEGFAPVLRASFFVFRVKVCRGGSQVVVAAPRAIRSPGFNPSRRQYRESFGSGVVFEDFVWLWESSDRERVLLAVPPSSSSSG
jgi:hypothetical protein